MVGVGRMRRYFGYLVDLSKDKHNPPGEDVIVKIRRHARRDTHNNFIKKPIGFRPPFANLIDVSGREFVRFHPDKHFWQNQVAAVFHRFGCDMPDPEAEEIRKFANFVRGHFRFFSKCRDWESHDTWLEKTSYSMARKQQLDEAFYRKSGLKWSNKNKSFIKDEGYDEYKMPRGINSYDDSTKVYLGPYIKSMEKTFFNNKFFVKGKTNAERDEALRQTFGNNKILYTDFSHFESHHRGVYAELFADFLFYMGGDSAEYQAARRLITGHNVSRFSSIIAECNSRLMSGALWTSFQNSFLNFFVMAYLNYTKTADKRQFKIESLKMFIEGDDGIMKAFNYNHRVVRRLGLCLKIKAAPHFSLASFCGRVISDRCCFTEPSKAIDKLFWFSMKYSSFNRHKLLSLFKARAMSMLENNVNCPILDPLARRILYLTRNVDARAAVKYMTAWERENFQANLDKIETNFVSDVCMSDRVLMEQLFGVNVDQQLWFEEEILPKWDLEHQLRLTWDCLDIWSEQHTLTLMPDINA